MGFFGWGRSSGGRKGAAREVTNPRWQTKPMNDLWNELPNRIDWLRNLYHERGIALKPDEGLAKSLSEAEAVVRRVVKTGGTTTGNLMDAVAACHLVWSLYDSLEGCISAGLDITPYLARMTTGTTDYGVPAAPLSYQAIFFKDFETELFIAASLARAGLPVKFLEAANDPRGEMTVGDIFLEVKHPNSIKSHESGMRKFNSQLRKSESIGVFITAVEDAFKLARSDGFESVEDFNRWKDNRDDEIENFGRKAVLRAARLERIAALVQTSSCVEVIGKETKFSRKGNSLIFDNRNYAPEVAEQVERIAVVFNPNPPRYLQVKNLLLDASSAE